jgi:PAS domain-containing protein
MKVCGPPMPFPEAEISEAIEQNQFPYPEDRKRTTEMSQRSIVSGLPLDVEYRTLDADGAWRSMRSRGEARRDSSGEITRWYGSVECIDDRQRATDQRRKA